MGHFINQGHFIKLIKFILQRKYVFNLKLYHIIYLSRAYHFISPIVQARTSRPSRTTASSTTVRARLWVR